jgi:hypothetical protein
LVKLPQPRVGQLIAAGHGEPFAPAGRVFREWVAIPTPASVAVVVAVVMAVRT